MTKFILIDISLVTKLLSLYFSATVSVTNFSFTSKFITILSLPPHLCLCLSFFLVSPEDFVTISIAPNVTLNRGDDISLTCNTAAGPDNVFTWVRQGNKVIGQPNTVDGKYHLCFK